MHENGKMDIMYGGFGNDKMYEDDGHDHQFGGSCSGRRSGSDLLETCACPYSPKCVEGVCSEVRQEGYIGDALLREGHV